MFEEKDKIISIKSQISDLQQRLVELKSTKSKTVEMLEEMKKQNEIKYLHPIIEEEKEKNNLLKLSQKEYIKILCEEFDRFSQQKSADKAKQLLDEYMFVTSLDKDIAKTINDKTHCLYEYFLKQEDIESAVTFLIYRSGSVFDSEKYDSKREKYFEHMKNNPVPSYHEYSKYILNYGDYREDIIRLFELCGRLDYRTKPTKMKKVYYSDQTKMLLAMGSIGEFGSMAYHIYYCPPFGTEDCDRETLMHWHDNAYKELESGKAELQEKEL